MIFVERKYLILTFKIEYFFAGHPVLITATFKTGKDLNTYKFH